MHGTVRGGGPSVEGLTVLGECGVLQYEGLTVLVRTYGLHLTGSAVVVELDGICDGVPLGIDGNTLITDDIDCECPIGEDVSGPEEFHSVRGHEIIDGDRSGGSDWEVLDVSVIGELPSGSRDRRCASVEVHIDGIALDECVIVTGVDDEIDVSSCIDDGLSDGFTLGIEDLQDGSRIESLIVPDVTYEVCDRSVVREGSGVREVDSHLPVLGHGGTVLIDDDIDTVLALRCDTACGSDGG